MQTPTFPFEIEVDYQDTRCRDRIAACSGTYSFDGEEIKLVSLIHDAGDWYENQVEDGVYQALEDMAHDDYAEWQAEYGEYLRDCAADRAVNGMPGVGA